MAYRYNPITGQLDNNIQVTQGRVDLGIDDVSNAIINAPESLYLNIDSANDSSNELFIIATNRDGSTGGTELLSIDENGNVGIGTTTVSGILHAASNSPDFIIQDTQSHTVSDGPLLQFQGKGPNATNYNFGKIQAVSSGSNNAGELQFFTNSAGTQSEAMRIDSSGNVGIGTEAPLTKLEVESATNTTLRISNEDDSTATLRFHNTGSTDRQISVTSGAMSFGGSTTELMQIDTDGRLLVGTTSSYGLQDQVQIVSDTGLNIHRGSANNAGPRLDISKSRNATYGSNTTVAFGDTLGSIVFRGDDGTDYTTPGAEIKAVVDQAPGSNDMPGRLVFSTTGDGNASPTEHFRIANNGDLTATDTTIGSNSDSRLKTNVTDFSYDLEDFKLYQPKTFDWKNPELHGNKTGQRGFIAQDVEAIDAYWVDQQAVDEDSADAQFLDADRLAKTLKLGKKDAMYISVIQQLLAKIETLEAKVAALEAN